MTPMKNTVAMWLFFRLLRWALWIAFFAYVFYVQLNRGTIVTTLNQLPLHVELLIYGLGVGAVFAGFFEMMMRERSGLARPAFGRMARPVSESH
jgi:hypothetical protein